MAKYIVKIDHVNDRPLVDMGEYEAANPWQAAEKAATDAGITARPRDVTEFQCGATIVSFGSKWMMSTKSAHVFSA